jgi:hypothetical protein
MLDIVHEIEMNASPSDIVRALLTHATPSAWWFSEAIAMRVVQEEEAAAGSRVAWRCTDGPPDWIDTVVTFELRPQGAETVVHMAHSSWEPESVLFARCATKWARFLMQLKTFVETPEPEDVLAG